MGICSVDSGGIDTSALGFQWVMYIAPADAAGNQENPIITFDSSVQLNFTGTIVDSIAPTLALNGDSFVEVVVNQVYTELNATILDNDKSINGTDTILTDRIIELLGTGIVGSVDTSIIGTYEITYNKSDPSGNPAAPVVRTVEVVADTVEITLATFHTKSKWLDIEITASDPAAIFEVYFVPGDIGVNPSIGTMTNLGGGLYDFRLKGTDPGLEVTVASSVLVQDTEVVFNPK